MTIDQNPTPTEPEATEPAATAEAPVEPATETTTTPVEAEATATEATAPDTTEPVTPEPTATEPVVEAPAEEAASPEEAAVEATATETAVTATDPAVTEAPGHGADAAEVAAGETTPEVVPVAETPAAPVAVAEPAPVAAPVRAVPVVNDMDLFESYMAGDFSVEGDSPEGGFKRLSKGERIEATVIQVDQDKVFVDLGTKAEGIVPLSELSEDNLQTAVGLFNIGDKISVIVIRPEGAEGNPIVSKKRADFEEVWDRVENAFKSQETLKAQVIDRVKGGLVVDVGVRGFVPATHVGSGKLRNIEKYVGQPLDLKVIEIDRDRKKVVLSNRQAEEERRAAAKDDIFTNVKPGDTLEGTVRRLADYGAFVDLGGVDGLLHISEMSWARITHPKEMFKEGQKIKVMVLRLDPGNGKISLGHRQVLPDPWNLIRENYKNQQKLTVNISRIVQSGAFIKLPEGAEAFMPVSEMSIRRIRKPQDVVEEGQEVEAQIIDLRPDERRMVLSMRSIGGGAELRPGATEAASGFEVDLRRGDGPKRGGPGKGGPRGGRRDEGGSEGEDIGGSSRRGFATGGATIGERLGALRGLLNREDSSDDEAEATPAEAPADEA